MLLEISSARPSLPPSDAARRRSAETGMPAGQVEAIYQDTWGHLKAKRDMVYEGFILFTTTCHGETTILDWSFGELPGSPWILEDMMNFVGSKVPERVEGFRLWRFDGTYRELRNGKGRFSGKVRPMRVQYRFAGRRAA